MSLSTKNIPSAAPTPVFPRGFAANEEPSLAEVLNDPIVRSVMASDHVRGDRLAAALDRVRSRLLDG